MRLLLSSLALVVGSAAAVWQLAEPRTSHDAHTEPWDAAIAIVKALASAQRPADDGPCDPALSVKPDLMLKGQRGPPVVQCSVRHERQRFGPLRRACRAIVARGDCEMRRAEAMEVVQEGGRQ